MKTVSKPSLAWPQPMASPESIIYPESDGQPMADNTKQFRAITTIQGNLDSLYADNPFVLVVGDLFWYPVEGDNKLKRAPDVMVVFGVLMQNRILKLRPKLVLPKLKPVLRLNKISKLKLKLVLRRKLVFVKPKQN